jgi:hypothetical protein
VSDIDDIGLLVCTQQQLKTYQERIDQFACGTRQDLWDSYYQRPLMEMFIQEAARARNEQNNPVP